MVNSIIAQTMQRKIALSENISVPEILSRLRSKHISLILLNSLFALLILFNSELILKIALNIEIEELKVLLSVVFISALMQSYIGPVNMIANMLSKPKESYIAQFKLMAIIFIPAVFLITELGILGACIVYVINNVGSFVYTKKRLIYNL